MRVYSNPKLEDAKWAQPDVEVFHHEHKLPAHEFNTDCPMGTQPDIDECPGTGWYYWYCLVGCLPDSDPYGPYESQEEAIKECRQDTYEDSAEDE
jgi:hypothetical protein